jgi:cysteine synthase
MHRTLNELNRIIQQLKPDRQALYTRLVKSALMTPLHQLGPDATGLPQHHVYLKLEYENDVGCHHRRLYPFVFALNEAEGKIVPGKTPVVEASVGGAACAFAYCARFLGFNAPRPPLAVVPWNVSPARKKMLQQLGAEIHFAPTGDRDTTVVELRRILAQDRELARLNGGTRLYCTTKIKPGAEVAYGGVVEEVLEAGVRPDILLSIVGSGATMSGMGRVLKSECPQSRIYVVEHEKTPVNSSLARGEVVSYPEPPHEYQGSGHWGVPTSLLNINFSLVDGYIQFASEEAEQARLRVLESEGINVGLTTSGCLAALKKLPLDSLSRAGQNILIVAHDTYQRSRHEPYLPE